MSNRRQERIDKYIVATAVIHNIAILEKDPQPLDDPDLHVPQPEEVEERHVRNVNAEDPAPRGHVMDRLAVRNALIQGYFTDLARR